MELIRKYRKVLKNKICFVIFFLSYSIVLERKRERERRAGGRKERIEKKVSK